MREFFAPLFQKNSFARASFGSYFYAKDAYGKSLNIKRKLARQAPDVFMPEIAMILFNILFLELNEKNFVEARKAAQEYLEIYRELDIKGNKQFAEQIYRCEKAISFIADQKK